MKEDMGSDLSTASASAPSAVHSWKMFDRIAFRYDLLNRLLSFRQDVGWRKQMARRLPAGDALRILDLATGTCDVLLGLYRYSGRVAKGVGLDMSANMLAHGSRKIAEQGLTDCMSLVRADAETIAARDDTFDATTIAFGIRNVPDVVRALAEMRRVLRPGGRALVLEFSLPSNVVMRTIYLLYFRHVLPFVGGMISGDRTAYRYLNESVEQFPYGEAFCELMRNAGYRNVQATPMTFGIATLYEGEK